MRTASLLLISLFLSITGYGQVAYGDATGTLLTIDPNFQLSAAGLYFQRPFAGATRSVIFSIDTIIGVKVSVAKNGSNEATGLELDTNATSSRLFYYGENDGGALVIANKVDGFGELGVNMLATNITLDTLAGFRAAQYKAQWVHKLGGTNIIQTLPNNLGANGYSLVTDGAGNTSWQPISGTLSDTAFRVLPVDFVGDSFQNPLLVNGVPDKNVLVFSDEGTGGLLFENDGYTMNPVTGTITPIPSGQGRYRILILR